MATEKKNAIVEKPAEKKVDVQVQPDNLSSRTRVTMKSTNSLKKYRI